MFLSYRAGSGNFYSDEDKGVKYFPSDGEAMAFVSSHPEYSDWAVVRYADDAVSPLDVTGTKSRRTKARAEALFHDKNFRSELEAPSVWIRNDEPESVVPLKETVFSPAPFDTPFYNLDENGRKLEPGSLRKRADGDERRFRERLAADANGGVDILKVRSLSSPDAAADAEKLLDCTAGFWSGIKAEALCGPSLETLYLKYITLDGIDEKYSDVKYTSFREDTGVRINGWDLKMILEFLQCYVFKPFNAVAGDKVLTLAPVIPAFTETQAKRILRKRLFHGAAAVFDGEVCFRKGQAAALDGSFPYDEFSLDRALGMKFDRLPAAEDFEIAGSFPSPELRHFFRLPFCRSRNTLLFNNPDYTDLIENPVLSGGDVCEKSLPGYCYIIPDGNRYYTLMNFFFVHMFGEELGIAPDLDSTKWKREEILPVFAGKKMTVSEKMMGDLEAARRKEKAKLDGYRKFHNILLEKGRAAIKTEDRRNAEEKESWLSEMRKTADIIENAELCRFRTEEEYYEKTAAFIEAFGFGAFNCFDINGENYCTDKEEKKRRAVLDMFFEKRNTGIFENVQERRLLEALALFRRINDPYARQQAYGGLSQELFCYYASFLNPLFDINRKESEYVLLNRGKLGLPKAEGFKGYGMNDAADSRIKESALNMLCFLALHARDPKYLPVLRSSGLEWLMYINDKDREIDMPVSLRAKLVSRRLFDASFLVPEDRTMKVNGMIKKFRRQVMESPDLLPDDRSELRFLLSEKSFIRNREDKAAAFEKDFPFVSRAAGSRSPLEYLCSVIPEYRNL